MRKFYSVSATAEKVISHVPVHYISDEKTHRVAFNLTLKWGMCVWNKACSCNETFPSFLPPVHGPLMSTKPVLEVYPVIQSKFRGSGWWEVLFCEET